MSLYLPKGFDPEGSVLFLGSGFSTGASNINNDDMPAGGMLRKTFSDLIGVNDGDYDLSTLATEIESRDGLDLYQILYETFTTKRISNFQENILNFPWLRVYTTNYDDVAEFAYRKNKIKTTSYSYDDIKPRKLRQGAIVHLHGVIRKTTPDNVNDQLVLNEHSYVRQHFEHSPWYDEFVRDIRFCTNCFFLGYSLSDYHISALMLKQPSVREKTFFVTRKHDQIFENRVSDYGSVMPIGFDRFLELTKNLPKIDRLKDPYLLKTLRYIDPLKDKKTTTQPTPLEILHLVTFGTFNEQRCMSSLPAPTYVVPRSELIEKAYELLKKSKTLLVHSKLGNGKTIFLSILAHKLSEEGNKCFWCREASTLLKQEAKALESISNVVILFDSYNVAIDAISAIAEDLPDAKFVIAIRTGIQEVRLHEILGRLPAPIERISLNGIREEERDKFKFLLDESGLLANGVRSDITRCSDIREVVTSLYRNEKIKDKLEEELKPLLSNKSLRTIIISSHLVKLVGLEGGASFLRAVTGKDAFAEISKFREVASDLFMFSGEDIQAHSAVFSDYIIGNLFEPEDISETLLSIIVESVRRKNERRYRAIMSKMMQISTIKSILRSSPDVDEISVQLFEKLYRDIDVNAEPLFWLQYSILMMDVGEMVTAEKFIDTAYSRAKSISGFRTFQIDTHALRLYLILEQEELSSKTVDRIEKILEVLEKVVSMAGEVSHRYFVLKVIREIEPFINKRLSALSISERNALLIQIDRLIKILEINIEQIDYDTRDEDSTLSSIIRAKGILLKG